MKRSIVCVILVGCAAMKQPDTLAESIRGYNDGVRWGRYSVAAARIPAEERSRFADEMDARSEDLRITDYEIIRVDQVGKNEAKVQIKISWYLDSVQTLRETHAVQIWERKAKTWFMVEEKRVRGAEMPGLPEPAAEAAITPR
jgi:hypothetical protein